MDQEVYSDYDLTIEQLKNQYNIKLDYLQRQVSQLKLENQDLEKLLAHKSNFHNLYMKTKPQTTPYLNNNTSTTVNQIPSQMNNLNFLNSNGNTIQISNRNNTNNCKYSNDQALKSTNHESMHSQALTFNDPQFYHKKMSNFGMGLEDNATNRHQMNYPKHLQTVFDQLLEENDQLLKIIKKNNEEKYNRETKIFIQEQMLDWESKEQLNLVDQFQQQIIHQQGIIYDQEQALSELEEIIEKKQIEESKDNYGIIIRNREVYSPSREELMSLHCRIEIQRQFLARIWDEKEELKQKKNELLQLSNILATEIQTIKSTQQYPLTSFKQTEKTSVFNNTKEEKFTTPYDRESDIIPDQQQKALQFSEGDLQSNFLGNLYEDKVKVSQQLDESKVPGLNLEKAQDYQDQHNKKVKNQQQMKELFQQQQKLAQQQQQLHSFSKQQSRNFSKQHSKLLTHSQLNDSHSLQNSQQNINQPCQQCPQNLKLISKLNEKINLYKGEIIKCKIYIQEEISKTQAQTYTIQDLKNQLAGISDQNEILIQSNMNYQNKWHKMNSTLNFYKEFYFHCQEMINQNNLFSSNKQKQTGQFPLLQDSFQKQFIHKLNQNQAEEDQIIDTYFAPESLKRYIDKKEFKNKFKQNPSNHNLQQQQQCNDDDILMINTERLNQRQNQDLFSQNLHANSQNNILLLARNLYYQDLQNINLQKKDNKKGRKRAQSDDFIDQPQKPEIYPLQLIKRIDKPIVRYLRQQQKHDQVLKEQKNILNMPNIFKEFENLDDQLHEFQNLDQEEEVQFDNQEGKLQQNHQLYFTLGSDLSIVNNN